MSELNPYTPPETNPIPEPQPGQQQLATPWIRLGAQILDGIIIMAINVPLMWVCGYWSRTMEAAAQGVTFRAESILWSVIGIGVFAAVNWKPLQKGQTIGKRVAGIRIVRKDGSPVPAMRIITHRLLPVQIAAIVPVIGSIAVLVDALMIFRPGRNTLHDDIADTKVIKL